MKDYNDRRAAHRRLSHWKSAVRIVGFLLLVAAELLGVLEEERGG